MNGGGFLNLLEDAAYTFLEQLSESSQQWDFSNPRDKQSNTSKKGGIYEIREESDIKARLDHLTRKVEALTLRGSMNSVNQIHNEVCSLCTSPMNTTQTCPAMIGYSEYHVEHVNALNNYGKTFASPFSETYNSNWRKHPNFLWRQNQPSTNVGGPPLQSNSKFPPGFHPPTQSYCVAR